MCDPISMAAATTAVSATSAIMGFQGQNQQAALNQQEANLGYAQSANEAGEQAVQIDQQQSENTMNAVINRVSAQGRISASAASMGGGAESTAAQANAAAFAAGRQLSVENINSAGQRLQVQNELISADDKRRSQIASVQKASPLSLVLGLAKAGLSGASAFGSAGGQFGGFGGGGGGGGAGSSVADQALFAGG